MLRTGLYVSVTGQVVELRKPPARKSEYYVEFKESESFFFDDFRMFAPLDIVLDVKKESERVIFVDKADAKIILNEYEYLGSL